MSEKTKVVFKRSKYYFCKTETAYEMRISDWSSDVCSSDLSGPQSGQHQLPRIALARADHSEDRHTDGAGAGHPVPRRQSRSTVPLDVSSELRPGAHQRPTCDRCADPARPIGRAHVCTPVTHAPIVCSILLVTKKHVKNKFMTID